MPNSCAVATITRARDDREANLLLASLGALTDARLPVFVADAGSVPFFAPAVKRLPNLEFAVRGDTLVQQVKAAFHRAAASGAHIVIYTEPDKRAFFESGLPPFVRQAGSLNAAVVIAARDAGALATFPQGQRRMEAMFRELCALFLGSVPDVLYGPLALRPDLVTPFIDAAPDDLGWGWRPYVIARAIRAGLPVSVHEGRFPCPPEQQAEDDAAARIYRLRQFHDNVRGLQQALLDAGRTVAPVRPA